MPTEPPDAGQQEPAAPEAPARRSTIDDSILDSVLAERLALGVFALVAIAAIAWIAKPIAIGILLGTLIAFSLQPVYERMVAKNHRPALTALGFVLVSS